MIFDTESISLDKEVFTETGKLLGRVRRVIYDTESGQVSSLVIASYAATWIPDQVISTYSLTVDEVVSTGPNRVIVFEGAENRLKQITTGIWERLGIASPSFSNQKQEEYYVRPPFSVERGVADWDDDELEGWDGGDVWDDEENDDYSGGIAPSPRPRKPSPSPISDSAAELPPNS